MKQGRRAADGAVHSRRATSEIPSAPLGPPWPPWPLSLLAPSAYCALPRATREPLAERVPTPLAGNSLRPLHHAGDHLCAYDVSFDDLYRSLPDV
eukprot:scaffold115966_cov30-Tisochrysis_lutea.AAC.2